MRNVHLRLGPCGNYVPAPQPVVHRGPMAPHRSLQQYRARREEWWGRMQLRPLLSTDQLVVVGVPDEVSLDGVLARLNRVGIFPTPRAIEWSVIAEAEEGMLIRPQDARRLEREGLLIR